ncbi:MAG: DNA methyltransferase, partial [Rhodospirillaceae bacterium]|nr:DNA methyltransferase [Rhodospirillaceae bacterium]
AARMKRGGPFHHLKFAAELFKEWGPPLVFLRKLVRGVLPLGEGVVLDTFAGAGSTLAAGNAVGYSSIGIEIDRDYFRTAVEAIPKLTAYAPNGSY